MAEYGPAVQPADQHCQGHFTPTASAHNLIGECDGKAGPRSGAVEREEPSRSFMTSTIVVRWLAKEAMFTPKVMTARVWRVGGINLTLTGYNSQPAA